VLIYCIFTGLELNSIHKSDNLLSTVKEAQGFFVGGGNTFLLLKTLYDLNLLEALKSRVLQVDIVTLHIYNKLFTNKPIFPKPTRMEFLIWAQVLEQIWPQSTFVLLMICQ
jgi:hypothetical protein